MKLQFLADDTLLSRLPKQEVDFLLNTAQIVLSRAKNDSLEEILRQTREIFSDKEYGWEESILDGNWYRYPSEVGRMRFCSEEALKNYLIIRTLGIPANYAIIQNYQDRGLAHEAVIVPDGSRQFLVDWNLSSGILSEKSFDSNGKEVISYDKLEYISEHEVLDRIMALRSGKSFLDAIESGQILYQRMGPEGEFTAYVQYIPKNQELKFMFTLKQIPHGLSFYYTNTLSTTGNSLGHRTENGIVIDGEDLSITTLPVILEGGSLIDLERRIGELDPVTLWYIGGEAIYNNILGKSDSKQVKYNILEDQRKLQLAQLRLKLEDNPDNENLSSFLNNYDSLRKQNIEAAERYLDFHLFNAQGIQRS